MAKAITGLRPLREIYLDPNNYRFRDNKEYRKVDDSLITNPQIQKRTQNFILGNKNDGTNDLIKSFKKSGFLPVDQIQVLKIKEGVYKVIEGNRRIATLKYLEAEYEKSGSDIGNLNPDIFNAVPVVYYSKNKNGESSHYKILMGLKHINGNKRWSLVNQAQLMEDMSQDGMTESDIIESIGITKTRLRRSLRALALVKAYKESDYGDQFQSDKFNVFDAAVGSTNIKSWLDWNDDSRKSNNDDNLQRFFSWVSEIEDFSSNEDEEQSENIIQKREPIIVTGRDVRELSKFIHDEEALRFMEDTESVAEAYLSSDQVGKDRFDTVLNALETNLNTALSLSSYAENHHSEKFGNIDKKLRGLIASQDLTEILLPKAVKPKVLYDFPATQHLLSLNVNLYKGIKELKVEKLSKINIFAGENNAGKTSLLEAIRTLIAQNNANDFLYLQQLRGKFAEGKLRPSWLVDNMQSRIEIEGEFGMKKNMAAIVIKRINEDNKDLNSANYLGSLLFEGRFMGAKHNSYLRLFEKKGDSYKISAENGLHHLCNFAYYTPFTGYRNGKLYDAHAESIEKKHLPKIIKFLKKSIDEDITNILLVEKNGLKRFLVEHTKFDQAVDLVQFGDGLQNIFRTALLFATAQNGIVLIDEMETAIHYSLLTQYTKFIQQLSETFNTQVFITSHSGECIDAFVDNNHKNEEISMYNMELDEGKVTCKYITGSRYKELNDLMGIDLRD